MDIREINGRRVEFVELSDPAYDGKLCVGCPFYNEENIRCDLRHEPADRASGLLCAGGVFRLLPEGAVDFRGRVYPALDPVETQTFGPLPVTGITVDGRPVADNGRTVGLKYDSGKPRWSLMMRGCAKALLGVVKVLTFGAKKYADDSWQNVDNAQVRYTDALYRHLHEIQLHGLDSVDPESGLPHIHHVSTNALFLGHFAEAAIALKGKA